MGDFKTLTIGDLFSGAGGITTGFHQAGFETLFFNDIDKQACETFELNFPSSKAYPVPIQELSGTEILKSITRKEGELDVMVGGPPCQGFSINAPLRNHEDARNHLFRHYVRLVLEGIKPKFILMENVPGLISLENGKVLHDVLSAFKEAGYQVIFKILNAAHYGVPEERWRLIFLGTRLNNIRLSFPAPKYYSLQRANFAGGNCFTFKHAIGKPLQKDLFEIGLKKPISAGMAIDDLPPIRSGGGAPGMPYTKKAQNDYQKKMRCGSNMIYNHECAGLSDINLQRLKHVKPGGSWRNIPENLLPRGLKRARRSDHTKRYGRIDPKKPSCTILTKCDPHWGTFIHHRQNRIISVREAARIQSFPDWFRFTGNKTEQYRQVGNAVPPLLAFSLAKHIQSLMPGATARKEEIYATC